MENIAKNTGFNLCVEDKAGKTNNKNQVNFYLELQYPVFKVFSAEIEC